MIMKFNCGCKYRCRFRYYCMCKLSVYANGVLIHLSLAMVTFTIYH